MKFFLLAMIVPFVLGKAPTFRAITNAVENDLNLLENALSNLQIFARRLNHAKIANKCNHALQQLSGAQNSWSGIYAGFSSQPWQTGASRLAGDIKSKMAQVQADLDWMFAQSECKKAVYQPYVNACQSIFASCQSGCNTVWTWPKTPTKPKPSQAASDYYRRLKRQDTLCPSSETACPISPNTPGIECIDTQSEITSCGGCVTKGEGENCLLIPGADAVGCNLGSCVVFSVNSGFLLSNITGRPEVKAVVQRTSQAILG